MVMERLTRRYETHVAVVCENCHKQGYCTTKECNEVLRNRLAAIEDILSDEYDLAHLRDLLQAEKDGRLAVLPCALETDIFRVGKKTIFGDWQVAYAEVYPDAIVMIDDSDNLFEADDIGKTVFLTREEAEAAIAQTEAHNE